MGGGKGSSTPDVDYESLVRTQGAINRPNVYNPYGSSEWTNQGDHYTQRQDFSPEMQALFEAQQDYTAQGPQQYQSAPLPQWAESAGRGALDRVNDRFGLGIESGGDLKPQQQMPHGPPQVDLNAIRNQARSDNKPPGVGSAGAFGRTPAEGGIGTDRRPF